MKISDHISYREATHSNTAKRRGIRNVPSRSVLENMKAVAENVFEPLRDWVGGPIKINSFFRSKELNAAIGGATSSQHIKGEAIDIDDVYGHKTNAQMFWYIVNNLEFDTIIAEYPKNGNPSWVHVSYRKEGNNRKRILLAFRLNGRPSYQALTAGSAKKYVF